MECVQVHKGVKTFHLPPLIYKVYIEPIQLLKIDGKSVKINNKHGPYLKNY